MVIINSMMNNEHSAIAVVLVVRVLLLRREAEIIPTGDKIATDVLCMWGSCVSVFKACTLESATAMINLR